MIKEQVRRNTEMFEQAMRMFLPFGTGAASQPPAGEAAPPEKKESDLDALRRQLGQIQKKLDGLSEKS